MGKTQNRIEHEGVVESVSAMGLTVNILQTSACLSCAVKGACNTAESDNKIVEVTRFIGDYQAGEKVNVFYERSLGFKALFLGYVLPFLILLLVLVVGDSVSNNEGIAGLLALGSLVPYYLVLYLLRAKLKQEFSFRVEKLTSEPIKFSAANFSAQA